MYLHCNLEESKWRYVRKMNYLLTEELLSMFLPSRALPILKFHTNITKIGRHLNTTELEFHSFRFDLRDNDHSAATQQEVLGRSNCRVHSKTITQLFEFCFHMSMLRRLQNWFLLPKRVHWRPKYKHTLWLSRNNPSVRNVEPKLSRLSPLAKIPWKVFSLPLYLFESDIFFPFRN